MAKPQQNAVAQLTPWEQKLFANNTLAQIQANTPKAWEHYTAATGSQPRPQATPAAGAQGDPNAGSGGTGMPGSGGGGAGGGGRGGGGAGGGGGTPIRDLFNQMGGRKGTNMDFKEFKDWYRKQSDVLGSDLGGYLATSGLEVGTLGQAQRAMQRGAGGATGAAIPFTAGSTVRDFANPRHLSDEGELYWINRNTGSNFTSLDEAMNALALPVGFGMNEQWNRNVSGRGGEDLPPHLRNMAGSDIRYDPTSWAQAFGGFMEAGPEGGKERLAELQKLVPEWAATVDKALQGQVDINREGQTGIPFGFELLRDPSINLKGGSQPLFSGEYPGSLSQLTFGQEGEGDFLRTASAEELMRDLWPIYHAQYNRPAGSAAPFEAGLSFGSPVMTGVNAAGGGVYTRSPIMGYNDENPPDPDLIRLEGYAGQSVPQEELYRSLAGGLYPRFAAQQQLAALPEHNALRAQFGMQPTTEEEFWQLPEYAPFQSLPPDVLARLLAVMNSPMGPGAQTTQAAGYA